MIDDSTRPQRWQLDLRTLLLLAVCMAVGATVASVHVDDDPDWPGFETSEGLANWHFGVLAGTTLLLIVGLAGEARAIRKSPLSPDNLDQSFGLWYAASWRLAIAVVLAFCLSAKVALVREIFVAPQSDIFFFADIVTGFLWWFAVIITLTAGVASHRSPRRLRRAGRFRAVVDLIVVGGTLFIAAYVFLDTWTVPYLVHVATQGVDASLINSRSRFASPTPQDRVEFELLAALSFAGLTAAALAGIAWLRGENFSRRSRQFTAASVVSILVGCSGIAWWFFDAAFASLSPDLAGSGFGASWWLFAGGVTLAVVAATTAAYRIVSPSGDTVGSFVEIEPIWTFHWSRLTMLALIAAAVMDILQQTSSSFFGLAEVFYLTTSYEAYLIVAMLTLALQLLWLRRRRGQARCRIIIRPLSKQRLWIACVASSIWLAIAVPTLAAACYLYWFGPWFTRSWEG